MNYEMIFAGFGGQGVMLLGKMVTFAAMNEGKSVSWFPSYGPEMRGGTANCTVVISDEEVGSPIVSDPNVAVTMNVPSFELYEKAVRPGGTMIYNSSMIDRKPTRSDIKYVAVPANDIATEIGNPRAANLVVLGALSRHLPFSDKSYEAAIEDALHKPEFMAVNVQAFKRGASL